MTMIHAGGNFTEEQYAWTVIGHNGFFDAMEKLLAAQADQQVVPGRSS